MLKFLALFLTLILWVIPEVSSVYFIMPLGGSQEMDMAAVSYFCYNYIWIFRIVFGGLFLYISKSYWGVPKGYLGKFMTIVLLCVYLGISYMTTFVMRADKMFIQPQQKILATASENKVPLDRLVLGVHINNVAHAYPVQYIAYHHQVVDTVGGQPLMATYCSVCRTGRIFSSKVAGKAEDFRLVGMSQWNAMVEDQTTGSWWQQATGEAIFGPLKGTQLEAFYCQQVTLEAWLAQYPKSLILQPDPMFEETYRHYETYETGNESGSLTRYDKGSWNAKSWIVGLEMEEQSIAYDWNALKAERLINDDFNGTALLLLIGKDDKSFRVLNRMVGTVALDFVRNDSTQMLMDKNTLSTWTDYGACLKGELEGTQLEGVEAYQEYWHSWEDFHPNTTRYPR